MRETEFKEIDGDKYACTMMPATKAHKTLVELVEVVGKPALVMAANTFATGGDIEIEKFVDIGMTAIFDRLDSDTGDRIVKSVLDGVRVDGKGDVLKDFDQHFRGRILHLYKVFAWALEVNYRDFFDAARGNRLLESLRAAGIRGLSQQTTTPESTASAPQTRA